LKANSSHCIWWSVTANFLNVVSFDRGFTVSIHYRDLLQTSERTQFPAWLKIPMLANSVGQNNFFPTIVKMPPFYFLQ
jgi:hypothetical protein